MLSLRIFFVLLVIAIWNQNYFAKIHALELHTYLHCVAVRFPFVGCISEIEAAAATERGEVYIIL